MPLPQNGYLLRIMISESDKYGRKPLYEWLVTKARELGLSGATVMRGMMGFGTNNQIHTSKILRISNDLPVIIEIVDTREKLYEYLADIEDVVKGGVATIGKVDIRFCKSRMMNKRLGKPK